MNLHRATEIQLHAMDIRLDQQRDVRIIPIRIYKETGKAPSIRCYAPGIVAFKHEWSKTAQDNSKKYYLHINKERAGQFIEGHDEASCRAEARYRIADLPDLWGFKDVWRWLEQIESGEGVGEESSSLELESGEKGLEDKEEEMKKAAERLARRRTEADVAAKSRGEIGGSYFSVHKHRTESPESKTALGEEERFRGSKQDLKESRDVEARGRNSLPQDKDPVAAPALASSNQGKWTNSRIGGGACDGVSGILVPPWYYNKWRRQTSVSRTLAAYTFPGIAR